MYKRVCLQTGENVVLLTVFVNIRKAGDEEFAKDDPFKDAKSLIARYAGILNRALSKQMIFVNKRFLPQIISRSLIVKAASQ